MRIVKNELYATDSRYSSARERLKRSKSCRSAWYSARSDTEACPYPASRFHEKWGVILEREGEGRSIPNTKKPIAGLYTAGWIKRGPSGVIGTNKPDALETVELHDGRSREGSRRSTPSGATRRRPSKSSIRERKPDYVSWKDWQRLDEIEVSKGEKEGRPRVKFTTVEEMQEALGR